MKWYEYEEACRKRLSQKFPQAEAAITKKSGRCGGDNGVDVRIEFPNGSLMYAQCKHFSEDWHGRNKVDSITIDHIRAFKWCMARDNVQRGYYFSSLPFDPAAEFIAKINGIEPVLFSPEFNSGRR